MGLAELELEFSKAWMRVVSPAALDTMNAGGVQDRPPDPEDADKSTVRGPQPRSSEDIVRMTFGTTSSEGAVTITEPALALVQAAQTVDV